MELKMEEIGKNLVITFPYNPSPCLIPLIHFGDSNEARNQRRDEDDVEDLMMLRRSCTLHGTRPVTTWRNQKIKRNEKKKCNQ